MQWFKFYGQDFLTDTKVLSLTAVERALYITILCLASANNGTINHASEAMIQTMTGIDVTDNAWTESNGFLVKFQRLGLITIDNVDDNTMITLPRYHVRQESNKTGYERVKAWREKNKGKTVKSTKTDDNNDNKMITHDNVINDNARIDKNRIDKNKKESIKKESSLEYLVDLPKEDVEAFHTYYEADISTVKNTAEEMIGYCKSKGRSYKDYRAALQNWLLRKCGKRKTPIKPKVDMVFDPERKVYVQVTSSTPHHDNH